MELVHTSYATEAVMVKPPPELHAWEFTVMSARATAMSVSALTPAGRSHSRVSTAHVPAPVRHGFVSVPEQLTASGSTDEAATQGVETLKKPPVEPPAGPMQPGLRRLSV